MDLAINETLQNFAQNLDQYYWIQTMCQVFRDIKLSNNSFSDKQNYPESF